MISFLILLGRPQFPEGYPAVFSYRSPSIEQLKAYLMLCLLYCVLQRYCILKNIYDIRKFSQINWSQGYCVQTALNYQFWLSLAVWKSRQLCVCFDSAKAASKSVNLAGEPDVYSLPIQYLRCPFFPCDDLSHLQIIWIAKGAR